MLSSRFDPSRIADLSRYWRGLGISVVCTFVAYPMYPHFDPVNIVMVYLLGATVAGLWLGRGPSAFIAVANTAAFDFFFVPPRFSFYVAEPQYLVTLAVMLGVAVIIANLMASVRSQTKSAAERERRTATLYAMSRELAVAADATAIAEVAGRHVSAALAGCATILLPDEHGNLSVAGPYSAGSTSLDVPTAQWTFDHNGAPGSLPGQSAIYLPLGNGALADGSLGNDTPANRRALCGVLVVELATGVPLTSEQQTLLGAFTGQIGLALERARLAQMATEARATAERSALRNTLLASISHDLRGPLAAIAGAGSLVANGRGALDRHRRAMLGSLIEEKAQDMSALLSNVLELVRLETATAPPPAADWQSLEELVATAVRSNEHRLGRWHLTTGVPANFPPLWADAQLIVQLISNLLENEVKYTPPGSRIELRAGLIEQHAVLSVEDDGPGFGDRDPETLFEKFERGHPEGHISGVGLGLAICRAIARLHGGEIRAMNRPAGGARFVITLPLNPVTRATGIQDVS